MADDIRLKPPLGPGHILTDNYGNKYKVVGEVVVTRRVAGIGVPGEERIFPRSIVYGSTRLEVELEVANEPVSIPPWKRGLMRTKAADQKYWQERTLPPVTSPKPKTSFEDEGDEDEYDIYDEPPEMDTMIYGRDYD